MIVGADGGPALRGLGCCARCASRPLDGKAPSTQQGVTMTTLPRLGARVRVDSSTLRARATRVSPWPPGTRNSDQIG